MLGGATVARAAAGRGGVGAPGAREPGAPQARGATAARAGRVLCAARAATRLAVASPALRVFGAALLVAFVAWWALGRAGGAEGLARRYGLAAAFVLVPLQALLALTPFPSQVVALPTLAWFGFGAGAALVWLGWWVAAGLQYALARRAAFDLRLDAFRARLPRAVRDLPVGHPAFLIVARWVPGGSHVVNAAAGMCGVPLARHLACAAVSIAPRALFFACVVHGIARL